MNIRRASHYSKSLFKNRYVVFTFLLIAVTLLLIWRFPNNLLYPNFYAEDGSVFLQNIIDRGWLESIFAPFNGYSIIGLYLLCGLGWIINASFLGGTLISLPVGFTLAAILCMAFVICLPYLLFASTLGKMRMLVVVAVSALLPLPLSPHIVIGTVGNQKWIFFYLAFLLVLYLLLNHKKLGLGALFITYISLLVAAYTNSTTYMLVPLLFVPFVRDYISSPKGHNRLRSIKKVILSQEFIYLLVFCFLLLPQVIYIATHGIPKLEGYLDTPFKPGAAIEIFINRTYLFGITHAFNGFLSNALVILLFISLLTLAWLRLPGREKCIFFIGIYAAGAASLLFVLNRPGVSDFFFGYTPSGSGPDQFFYAQTLIMYIPIILVLTRLVIEHRQKAIGYALPGITILFLATTGLASNATAGERYRNLSPFENDAGTFIDQALITCGAANSPEVRVTVYPHKAGQYTLAVPRDKLCNNKLNNYQPSVDDFGLSPNNNDYFVVAGHSFTQTFTATQDNLEGIRLLISTFGKPIRQGVYSLQLRDKSCTRTLRSASISTLLLDSALYNVRFIPVENSHEKTYCFTLQPPKGTYDPIALQQSKPNIYLEGTLKQNTQTKAEDVVFMPLYSQDK